LADKVKQAALLMLNGTSPDDAAAAAGFKASAGGGRSGRTSASLRLAAALRRAGLRVTAKRGAWAQDADEFSAASRRGGAVVDLAKQWGGLPRHDAPAVHALRAGAFCGASCLAAARVRGVKRRPGYNRRVIGLHPLSRATSSGDAGAVAVVTPSPLPLLPGQVRRIVRASSRRKLRGVLRSV
jgi:hypothetical protein